MNEQQIKEAAEKEYPIRMERPDWRTNQEFYDANESDRNIWIAGALSPQAKKHWQEQGGLRWVKATDRLPDKRGIENSVIIRNNNPKNFWVSTGFTNFDKENPSIYFLLGAKSFLTVNGEGNGYSTYNIEFIEWLDESGAGNDDKDIEELTESLHDQKVEIERLKGLLETEVKAGLFGASLGAGEDAWLEECWQKFKKENNI